MKKFGIIIFSMAIGFLYAENGWADKMITAQGTVTADCYVNFNYEGDIEASTPTSTSNLQQKCNVTYPDCHNSCRASVNTSKTLKKRVLKTKTHK